MAETMLYASCRIGELLVGIDANAVQEVTTGAELTPVPLAPPLVIGLLNLRGHVVTVIDLRRCLHIEDRPAAGTRPVHVILRTADGGVSLLVDEVGDVVTLEPETMAEASPALPGHISGLITGTYEFDGKHLLALDVDRVLDAAGERTAIGG